MKPSTLLQIVGLSAFLGLASFALARPAHAGVHVSVGIGLPVPVIVAPPPAVVYPAPVIVGPGYYGYYGSHPGYWRQGYRHGYWRPHTHHRGHRGHRW